jgi:hypothetical protein
MKNLSDKRDKRAYYAHWSPHDRQWVGTCSDYSYLSWLDDIPSGALFGIKLLSDEADADLELEAQDLLDN